MVVVFNHPSWWDPLVALALCELLPNRGHYGPIDATALGKYRFFEKLGFYGVEQGTRQGALTFLRTSLGLLAQPNNTLWITAQGRFTDPRERPLQLRQGVGHLVRRLQGGVILPLALEYPFWEERYPEALARFGAPIAIGDGGQRSVEEWMRIIGAGLTDTQDALARSALARKDGKGAFDTLDRRRVLESAVFARSPGGRLESCPPEREAIRGRTRQAGYADRPLGSTS